jgi:hypothetical protein
MTNIDVISLYAAGVFFSILSFCTIIYFEPIQIIDKMYSGRDSGGYYIATESHYEEKGPVQYILNRLVVLGFGVAALVCFVRGYELSKTVSYQKRVEDEAWAEANAETARAEAKVETARAEAEVEAKAESKSGATEVEAMLRSFALRAETEARAEASNDLIARVPTHSLSPPSAIRTTPIRQTHYPEGSIRRESDSGKKGLLGCAAVLTFLLAVSVYGVLTAPGLKVSIGVGLLIYGAMFGIPLILVIKAFLKNKN